MNQQNLLAVHKLYTANDKVHVGKQGDADH